MPKMSHTSDKKLLSRIRRIKGQVDGLEKLLLEGKECASILQQIAAVRGATNGLMHEVLIGHIREHLGDPASSAQQRSEDIEEVVTALKSYMK